MVMPANNTDATTSIDCSLPTCAPGLSIHLRNRAHVIPKAGGEIPYLISLTNKGRNTLPKEYITWSVITTPNGDKYSLSRKRKLRVGADDETLNPVSRVSIPSQFPSGEYVLTQYLEDKKAPRSSIESSSLKFKKLPV